MNPRQIFGCLLTFACFVSTVLAQKIQVPKGLKMFEKCDGQKANYKKYARDKYSTAYPCLATTVGESKYCLYQCGLDRLGYVDDEGNPNLEKIKGDMYKYKFYNKETTEKLIQVMKECTEGKKFTRAHNCKTTREAYYCAHNKYIEACKVPNEKKLNVNEDSGEGDSFQLETLDDELDLGELLGD